MALICATSFSKYPTGVIFRVLNHGTNSQKTLKFSTAKLLSNKLRNTPIKYSTNKAAKVEIAETLGFKAEQTSRIPILINLFSFTSFLVYFCILREENDVDEILKGNVDALPEEAVLTNLKINLKYCEKMKLPTAELKAKIQELEKNKKQPHSPFIK